MVKSCHLESWIEAEANLVNFCALYEKCRLADGKRAEGHSLLEKINKERLGLRRWQIMNVMPFGTKLQSKTWQNNTHNTIRNDTFFVHICDMCQGVV